MKTLKIYGMLYVKREMFTGQRDVNLKMSHEWREDKQNDWKESENNPFV